MFEYDPDKNAANLAKHGIDFAQAQVLWEDDWRLETASDGGPEQRWLVIGNDRGSTLDRDLHDARRKRPHHLRPEIKTK